MSTLFYTAAVVDGEFRSSLPPDHRSYGRVLRDGTLIEIDGPRHANRGPEGTMCGIPASEIVLVGVAFAPDVPGACARCLAATRDFVEEDG
jgi:hypothetical protein